MRYPPLLAVALAAAIAVPAAAQSTAAVRYSDLDLSTTEGREELDNRIDKAARSVCGMDETIVGTRLVSRDSQRCFTETRARINEQVATRVARDNSRG